MALSLANGCRMWYTLRAGLLAGVGAFLVCFGWLPGAPSSYMCLLYHCCIYLSSVFAKNYHDYLQKHGLATSATPGRSPAEIDGGGGYAAAAGGGVTSKNSAKNKKGNIAKTG